MKFLDDINLTLLFSGGVSLKTWATVGILSRELMLYHRLAQHLNDVSFITYGGRRDKVYARDVGNIRILPMPSTRWWWLQYQLLRGMHGKSIRAVDILKTNQIHGADLAIRLKNKFGSKLIVRCGYLASFFAEMGPHGLKSAEAVARKERHAFEEADLGVVTTELALRTVTDRHGIDPAKMRVVPNYVDVDTFKPSPSDLLGDRKQSLIFVGRLHTQKNLHALFDALGLLKTRRSDVPSLILVGSGPDEGSLRVKAELLGIEVQFLGNVPSEKLPTLLNKSDVFVFPSLYEGHPKALLEAMACELPCIATDVPGIQDQIRHMETGFLCGTDPESIAVAIDAVLRDDSLRNVIGSQARKHIVETSSLHRVLQMELAILEQLTGCQKR